MIGSTASSVASVSPEMVRSVHGDTSHAQPIPPGVARSIDQRHRKPAARTVCADSDMTGSNALISHVTPCRQRVLEGRGEGMLGASR